MTWVSFTVGKVFCLQMNESKDVAGLEVLLAFVRYVYNADDEEDFFVQNFNQVYHRRRNIQDVRFIYE